MSILFLHRISLGVQKKKKKEFRAPSLNAFAVSNLFLEAIPLQIVSRRYLLLYMLVTYKYGKYQIAIDLQHR